MREPATNQVSVSVTVIVVAYEAEKQLPRCLCALAEQSISPAHVIVVDNASADDSAAIAEAAGVRVIRAGSNLGFAAANNLAAHEASTEWIAFLNPDAYAAPDWLERLLDATTRWPMADAFGSTQIDANDKEKLDGIGDGYFFGGVPYRAGFGHPNQGLSLEGEVFGPCAAAALWRRETFLALGGFEERFFCYGEDVDLAYRHRLAGGHCVQVPDAVVAHEGSGITGRRSDFTTYHGHRNRIWTYLRDTPLPLLIVSLPVHLALNTYLIVRMAQVGQLSAYLRAMKDAVRGAKPFLTERKALHRGAASTGTIARALTWSPLALFRRHAKIWR